MKPTLTGNHFGMEMSKNLPFSPILKYNPTSTNYISITDFEGIDKAPEEKASSVPVRSSYEAKYSTLPRSPGWQARPLAHFPQS